jgi:hypothetical protein
MWAEININISGFALKQNENVHSFINFYWHSGHTWAKELKKNKYEHTGHSYKQHSYRHLYPFYRIDEKIIFKSTQQ